MKEKKVEREVLYKDFEEMVGKGKEHIIAIVCARYDLQRTTATSYYYQWKKEYMKTGHTAKVESDESDKAEQTFHAPEQVKPTEKQPEPEKEETNPALMITSMTISGEHGNYIVEESGITLQDNGAYLKFETIEDLDIWYKEWKKVFSIKEAMKVSV